MLILKELEKMLDDSLKSETKESLTEWLLSMREMEDEDPEIAACTNEHFWEILCDNASEPINQTNMKRTFSGIQIKISLFFRNQWYWRPRVMWKYGERHFHWLFFMIWFYKEYDFKNYEKE